MTSGETQSVLELGEDHRAYGEYSCGRLSTYSAWAISIGAEKGSPSAWAKGDPEFANEDGLLLAEQGDLTLLAVADAHFGRQPSHTLLTELRDHVATIPGTSEDLTLLLSHMAQREPAEESRGGTSFLIAIHDRATGRGFGASYWDSTFAVIGTAGHHVPIADRHTGIVYLADPTTLDPANAARFTFRTEPGDLLLAYTDGVDCCNYDKPQTSVTPAEMEQLFAIVGGDDAERYLRAMVELAMAGVNGNPGGEDNIAAIAVRA